MECSCGCTLVRGVQFVVNDERHGEKTLRTAWYCAACGREVYWERPLLRTTPTKEERAANPPPAC